MFLQTTSDYCHAEQQAQRDACGSVHTTRVTQQCLHVLSANDSEEATDA